MKSNILLIALIALLPFGAFAQNTAVDDLFNKYSEKEGFTTVSVSKYMFELFSKIETGDKDAEQIKEVTNNLEQIRILTLDHVDKFPGLNFYSEVMSKLNTNGYKELMRVKDADTDLKMMIKETQGVISEFLLVIGGDENVLISIEGIIDLENISKLSKSLKINGMDKLEELDKKKETEPPAPKGRI